MLIENAFPFFLSPFKDLRYSFATFLVVKELSVKTVPTSKSLASKARGGKGLDSPPGLEAFSNWALVHQ